MDGHERPVEQRDERVGRGLLVVGVDELLRLAEQVLGALGLGIAAGLDEVEIGRRREQVAGLLGRDRGAHERVRLVAVRQSMLRLLRAGLALGVVERPLVQRDEALPRLVDELLAELDGLGQDDLFLGGQQGDLADLLEVHPDRVIDADHVGADGLEVLGGRLLDLLGVELGRPLGRELGGGVERGVVGDDLDVHLGIATRGGGLRTEVEIVVVVVIVVVIAGDGGGTARGAHAGELGLFEIGLCAARPREHGLHELLVERIGGHGFLLGDLGQARTAAVGRASNRVSSRRRSMDRRVSLTRRISSWSRSMASVSPARSASAKAASRKSLRSRS